MSACKKTPLGRGETKRNEVIRYSMSAQEGFKLCVALGIEF
jgi:hypothetical protein